MTVKTVTFILDQTVSLIIIAFSRAGPFSSAHREEMDYVMQNFGKH